jgi:hypothetical protein
MQRRLGGFEVTLETPELLDDAPDSRHSSKSLAPESREG